MTIATKVKSLQARSMQAATLCFEVGGVLDGLPAQLGAAAAAFDFSGFYTRLRSSPTVANDPSRLLFGFEEIDTFTKPFALATLRAEPSRAALRQAVNRRQNTFFARYANTPDIIAQLNAAYSPAVPGSKPDRLARLRSLAIDQAQVLRGAYGFDDALGVAKSTSSTLVTTAESNSSVINNDTDGENTVADEKGSRGDSHTVSNSTGTHDGTSNTNASGTSTQTVTNTDRYFRTPFFESQVQYERARVSLIDEQFKQFLDGQSLPRLTQAFANELQSLDADVYRLQVAFLSTILMSPFAGVVTGTYKNPGECVRPGEPVVRVENNATVLLVGKLICRSRIDLGVPATISTQLFDTAESATTQIRGSVVAARGHDDDDEWDTVIQCPNVDKAGNPILPFGYRFDYDNTSVVIG